MMHPRKIRFSVLSGTLEKCKCNSCIEFDGNALSLKKPFQKHQSSAIYHIAGRCFKIKTSSTQTAGDTITSPGTWLNSARVASSYCAVTRSRTQTRVARTHGVQRPQNKTIEAIMKTCNYQERCRHKRAAYIAMRGCPPKGTPPSNPALK